MIEVEQLPDGWRWTMIDFNGRVLVDRRGYCSEACAIGAARTYRAAFFIMAADVDHRQGACV